MTIIKEKKKLATDFVFDINNVLIATSIFYVGIINNLIALIKGCLSEVVNNNKTAINPKLQLFVLVLLFHLI